jgi:large subunit ribosomal protein L33
MFFIVFILQKIIYNYTYKINIITQKNTKIQNKRFKKMSDLVKLICTECGRENYHTYKNKKKTPGRLEFKKYCPFLRKHTVHREKK